MFKERKLFDLKVNHDREELEQMLSKIRAMKEAEESKIVEPLVFNSPFDRMLHKMKTKVWKRK